MNSVSGKTFPTINPATEEKIADIQEGDKVSYFLITILDACPSYRMAQFMMIIADDYY